MRPLLIALLSFGVTFASKPALSVEWQSGESGQNAWAEVSGGSTNLRLSCNQSEQDVRFLLSGGLFEGMKNVDDGHDTLMTWITLPDGRTARHPIDGYYHAPDRAFVGRFLVSDIVMEQFRNGSSMSLTTSQGNTLAKFSMKGTGKARGHFRQSCGL